MQHNTLKEGLQSAREGEGEWGGEGAPHIIALLTAVTTCQCNSWQTSHTNTPPKTR